MFDQLKNRVIMQARLYMERPLAIGARLSLEPSGTDLPVIKDPAGRPFIPGSSLKGVVRAHLERLLRALDRRPQLWACDPLSNPCVPPSVKRDLVEQWTQEGAFNDQQFTKEILDRSCTTCKLFGSPWLAGRLAFKDAFLDARAMEGFAAPLTYIRDGVGIDRDLGAARRGIKYDFEAVIPGAVFRIEILGENLEDWEIGLLLTALQFWEDGFLPLGGKSTRGVGWGRLEWEEILQVRAERLLDYMLKGALDRRDIQSLREAFHDYYLRASGPLNP